LTDKWKVTISFYTGKPEVYRNQTDAQVRVHERRYLNNDATIKHIRIDIEPKLKIVKDEKKNKRK
jgi:hypothetical protein